MKSQKEILKRNAKALLRKKKSKIDDVLRLIDKDEIKKEE